jgi:hypothetical protein
MPDWEAMGMVGGNLGYAEMPGDTPEDRFSGTHNDQAEALAKTQFTTFLHDNYGLDFIEGGALLAMLMELRQRNLITPADLDGIDLQWGDVHAVDAMMKKIVYREGVGDQLAQGTWEAAKYFAAGEGQPGNHEVLHDRAPLRAAGPRRAQPAGQERDGVCHRVNVPCEHTGGGGGGFKKGDWDAAIAGQNNQVTNNSLVHCSFAAGHWAGKTGPGQSSHRLDELTLKKT